MPVILKLKEKGGEFQVARACGLPLPPTLTKQPPHQKCTTKSKTSKHWSCSSVVVECWISTHRALGAACNREQNKERCCYQVCIRKLGDNSWESVPLLCGS